MCFCCGLAAACQAQSTFTDVTAAAGIQLLNGAEGVAVGDFNNDGWDDLYVSYTNRINQLYKNRGDGTFAEIGQSAGVAASGVTKTAVWGDINNDGYPDLFVVSQTTPGFLFLNNGNETFTNITQQAGINQTGSPISANMADLNNDGYLDIYIANFLAENTLYINNKNNTFTNYTYPSRALDSGKSMGVVVFDYDKDGDADLYLVHDGNEPNFLYQNNGSGNFTEVSHAAGVDTRNNGMGVDAGDINNDGYSDLYITNLYKNVLLKNNGNGTFTDISASAGVDDNGMGWGCTYLDYDNDGWLDIYVANDYGFSPYPNVLYRNLGNMTFTKAEVNGPVSNLYGSYGAACLDFNQDGNTDLVVANRSTGQNVQLFKNAQRPGNWVGLKLVGVQSNRDAIGAKVTVTDGNGMLHYRESTAGHGWTSQNSPIFRFGVGGATSIQKVMVYWPSGLQQTVQLGNVNTYYTLVEGGTPQVGLQVQTPTSTQWANQPTTGFTGSVSPNPARGSGATLSLFLPNASPLQIQVFDAMGRLVFTRQLPVQPPGACTIPLEPAIFSGKTGTEMLTIRITGLDGAVVRKLAIGRE